MRHAAFVPFTVLVWFPASIIFADTPPKDSTASPREQYESIVREYDKAMQDFRQAYGEAKTDGEKNKLMEEKYPWGQQYLDRFLAIAEKYPKDPSAVDSLVWILRNARGKDNEKLRRAEATAMDLIIRHHLADERITKPFFLLVYELYNPAIENFFRTVIARSPNRVVRGMACFYLGQHLIQQAEAATFVKKDPKNAQLREIPWGKENVKRLLATDPEQLQGEAENLFELVVTKYGDVKPYTNQPVTLGEQARAGLFEIRHLSIGKTAPDIEGEDIEGKRFKLSEYRGKVVVLDFWGHW